MNGSAAAASALRTARRWGWTKAAAAALACTLGSAAFQADALVIPKGAFSFGRGFHGTPHEVPGAGRGMHGAGETFLHPERVTEPDIFTTAAEQVRRQQEQAARQQAAMPHDAAPWPDQPYLKVRLTGEPAADAAWIARLEHELAGKIDPARLRVASLADDAPTDRTLDAGLPSGIRSAGRSFERVLRRTPDALDVQRLAAALQVHRGSVLLLIAHIDANRPVIVFRDAHGGQREISLQALHWAELQAGVDVVLIGCNSAAHRAAGFADSLNSLDAATAVLRAAAARPASYRELFGQLAGPQLEMLIDPVRFEAHGEMAFTRPGSEEPVSTVRWKGAPSLASAPPAAGPAASAAPPADALGSNALDPAAETARVHLAGMALLSWLAGVALGAGGNTHVRARVAMSHAVWHVAILAVLASAFAEAVTDSFMADVYVLAALGIWILAMGVLGQAMRKKTSRLALHALNALRATLVGLPFLFVWRLFEQGQQTLGEGLRSALQAGYQAVRVAPEIGLAFTLGAALVWAYYFIVSAIEDRIERRRRMAQARSELQAIGVTRAANLASALRAMQAFAKELRRRDGGNPYAPSVRPIAEMVAPDPWADGMPRHFVLLELSFAATSVLGVARAHTHFVHPLPEVLAEAWHRGDVGADALPRLLALIEPGLKAGDYIGVRQRETRRLFRIGRWGMAAAAVVMAVAAWFVAPSGPEDHLYAWVLGAAAAGAALVGALLVWPSRWLLHDWHLERKLRQAIDPSSPKEHTWSPTRPSTTPTRTSKTMAG